MVVSFPLIYSIITFHDLSSIGKRKFSSISLLGCSLGHRFYAENRIMYCAASGMNKIAAN